MPEGVVDLFLVLIEPPDYQDPLLLMCVCVYIYIYIYIYYCLQVERGNVIFQLFNFSFVDCHH